MVSSGKIRSRVDDKLPWRRGTKWRYLQILVVVPSQLEDYKTWGPKTVAIFELPEIAEDMGIGCSRYFTKKLAERICPDGFPLCLMMDDSVQYWRGITLPDDCLNLFGEEEEEEEEEGLCLPIESQPDKPER